MMLKREERRERKGREILRDILFLYWKLRREWCLNKKKETFHTAQSRKHEVSETVF